MQLKINANHQFCLRCTNKVNMGLIHALTSKPSKFVL